MDICGAGYACARSYVTGAGICKEEGMSPTSGGTCCGVEYHIDKTSWGETIFGMIILHRQSDVGSLKQGRRWTVAGDIRKACDGDGVSKYNLQDMVAKDQ